MKMLKETLAEFGQYTHHVSVAVQATKEVNALIRDNSNLGATLVGLEFKATIDQMADDAILSRIRRNFPNDAILTEESGFPVQKKERLWVIDPLDGTTNLLNGLRMYASLISYTEAGKPVVSVAGLPASNEILVAVAGKGAFLNGRKIEVPDEVRPLQKSNIVLDPGYDPEGSNKIGQTYKRLRTHVGNIGMFNSNGYTLSLMAMGEVAGLVHFSSKIWEVAGLHIVQESGGIITDFDGKPLTFDFRQPSGFEFVATRGLDHSELLKLIK